MTKHLDRLSSRAEHGDTSRPHGRPRAERKLPANGFRLMVAVAGYSLVAPVRVVMPGETSRHLFNVSSGYFAGACVLDIAVLYTLGTTVVVYLL
jgi:hypothetical protein